MSKYMMMPRLLHKYTPELNVVVQDLLDAIERQKRDGGHRVDDVLGILHAWAFESAYILMTCTNMCFLTHTCVHACMCAQYIHGALCLQALPSLFLERNWMFCAILRTSLMRPLNSSR